MGEIKIIYYGHSCFTVEVNGVKAAFDPYEPSYVPGLSDLDLSANCVFCSHGHGDHSYKNAVGLIACDNLPTAETIAIPHDDAGGAKRGMNTITILDMSGYKIVHMGDTGCTPPESDMQKLRGADVLFIPIGGHYTIDSATANFVANDIGARITIPMHYRSDRSGFAVISTADEFIRLRGNVRKFASCMTLKDGDGGFTAVLEQEMTK